jgi:hypothetical protein
MSELFEYLEELRSRGIFTTITTARVWKGVFHISMHYFTDNEEKRNLAKVFDVRNGEYIVEIIKNMEKELLEETDNDT